MSFLFPIFLGAFALLGLPLALHFLRQKPTEKIPFPTLRFLGASAMEATRRHRIQRWITLLLRCLIIALFVAAFARPFFPEHTVNENRALVIAIDNSYSMQATGRWEALRAQATRELNRLRPGDRAALLLVNPQPSWLVPMTDDLNRVRRVLQEQ